MLRSRGGRSRSASYGSRRGWDRRGRGGGREGGGEGRARGGTLPDDEITLCGAALGW